MPILGTVTDEGASISIMSSTTWKTFGSLQLVHVTHNLLPFNRGNNQPLWILPKFPITFGGKNIYIDVIVVQVPFYFNLLGCDYVDVMGALVSSLFRVICWAI